MSRRAPWAYSIQTLSRQIGPSYLGALANSLRPRTFQSVTSAPGGLVGGRRRMQPLRTTPLSRTPTRFANKPRPSNVGPIQGLVDKGVHQVVNGAVSAGLDTVLEGAGSISSGAAVVADAAASIAPALAAVAIPLGAAAVIGYAIFGGKSDKEQLWEAQMQAQYGFQTRDVVLTGPDGDQHHFGNYRGPPPVDMGLRRGGKLL